jgi:hypothetical protein
MKKFEIHVNRMFTAALLRVKQNKTNLTGDSRMKWTTVMGSGVLAAMMAFQVSAAEEEATSLQEKRNR